MSTITELLNDACQVRDADQEKENTALRVGTMLIDIIQYLADNLVDTTTLEEVLADYAALQNGQVHWRNSHIVFLASMGAELDNVDGGNWQYTSNNGDLVYNPSSRGIRVVGELGTYVVMTKVVYVNTHTGHAYFWDATQQDMVELTDSKRPTIIDYMNTPPFSQVAVGESYYYTSGSTRKIAIKLSSDEVYSFDPDSKKIYVFLDTKQVMVWDSGNRQWISVGGNLIQLVNDLTTGGGDKALSAEMGKVLKQMIDDVELPMTDTENADLDFQDEDGNVIMRLMNGHIKTKNFNSAESGSGSSDKEISILFVGNSLTQDAVSYLPLVLKELAPDLSFKFYIWYDGGYTLTQILNKWNNSGKAEIFSVCENGTSWTNYNNSKTIASVLSSYTFDVVCLEEYFNYKRANGYTAEDKQVFNDIITYIRGHYNKAFKVVSFFHQPLRKAVDGSTYDAIADQVFALTKAGVQWQLQNTISESLIPAGIATYRAMDVPSLDSLGQTGHLSPDGTHSQEGLPCLMQAWVVALWIFDHLGLPLSINNAQQRVTSSNYSSINVPGPNLGNGVVVGTTEQDRLAMDVAVKAYKEGKYIELNALTSYTE